MRFPCASALVVGWSTVSAPASPAQQVRPLTEPPAFRIEQWTTEQGLPQNSVNAIVQGADGYLWIGTFGGLVRFDGLTFRTVERTDSAGRHVDRILALAVAPDGGLWIGTEQTGLLRYRDGVFQSFTVADGLPGNAVPALHVDRSGTLWVGGQQGGIARLAGDRFLPFAEADGEPLDQIVGFRETADGTLWVNTGNRFITLEDGVLSRGRWRRPPVAGAVRLVLEGRDGARWFGLANGVARVAGASVRTFGASFGVPSPALMLEDPGGGYWAGTDNDGLFFLEPDDARQVVRRYALPDGRSSYRVRSSHVDLEGNVWFGTNANGLLRARRNLFTTYTMANGLSNDVATAVRVDAAGTVWAATNCWGVNAMDLVRGEVRVFKPRMPNDPDGDPCVFSLTESPAGTMWIGTWGGGLTRLTGGREERVRPLAGLRDSIILALYTARDGAVWVGTHDAGLVALEGRRVREVWTTAEGLAHDNVRAIHQTRDGAMWIGTLGGLSRLADGRITTYTAADGLSAEHVRSLYEDPDANLWIGTYGGGLVRLRDGAFRQITRRDGLADDVVSAILEDDRGFLWMSGNRGIYRVARRELVAFTEGRIRRVHSVLYGVEDGLRNAETNGGFQPAAWRGAAGRLWFPTVEGVAVVDPARVTVGTRPPPLAIEEVVVDGVPRPAADGLVVGPGRPNLEFRYAGLSLSNPGHVIYRYRLEGFDGEWVDAGGRRVAYYPRLPPGRYRFVVTAANRDGVWTEAGAGLAMRVVAPFWSTWWFRFAVAAALLAAGGVTLWRREATVRRQRAVRDEFSRQLLASQEHERKRIAGALHDGLGQDLLVVKNRALLALKVGGLDAAVRDQLQQIGEVVTHSIDSVRGLAHNLTPYQLDHLGLSAALKSMVETVAEASGITVEATVEDVDALLPPDHQITLYRIVQEGLNNVVRHADARRCLVYVRGDGDAIRVTIADDGRGFPVRYDETGRLAGGFGLSEITERVRILDGRVHVSGGPGRGTRIELSVPVTPPAERAP